jgi:branched-chain amino acid transport system ATP-binding protein
MVALIGANGSGKSTTMKALAGLQPADSGVVTFEGEDVTDLATHRRVKRGLAFLPERPLSVMSPLTVEENLQLSTASKRGNPKALVAHVYELFPRLEERRGQRAGSLSGGEQQMMAIGRVLMTDPSLLMIDSPAIGLAPAIVDEVYQAITDLHAGGLSILFIEQNAELALIVSDYTYLLHRGAVALEGRSSELAGSSEIVDAYLA